MNQEYVTCATAELLREAGYPQGENENYLVRPLLSDAKIWLRREHGLYIIVMPHFKHSRAEVLWFSVKIDSVWDVFFRLNDGTFVTDLLAPSYDSYEDARDAAIAASCRWTIEKKGLKS